MQFEPEAKTNTACFQTPINLKNSTLESPELAHQQSAFNLAGSHKISEKQLPVTEENVGAGSSSGLRLAE
jgi:hypothetical protein